MRRTLLSLLAATTFAVAVPGAAGAQSALSINERQASLEARIDAGIRNRTLTSAEAAQLRSEFQALARLEAQYRATRPGLTAQERADLDQRFDLLSRRIQYDRQDDDRRGDAGWDRQNINQRQAELDARIDAGVRNRTLTSFEAAQLRREFAEIAQLEARYRASGRGLTPTERADLDQRFDALDRRIGLDRNDDEQRWTNLDQRQVQFRARLDQAVRDGRISSQDARNLRAEFDNLARLERQYRRSQPGITQAERVDLNNRFAQLRANFRMAARNGRNDNQNPLDNLFEMFFGVGR